MTSTQTPGIPAARGRGLLLALSLSTGLLLLSFSRIAGDTQSMGFRNSILDSMFAGDIWGSALLTHLALFALALLVLHLAYGVACWWLGQVSAVAWDSPKVTRRQHVFVWFLVSTVALLAYNAAFFPRSSLGGPYALTMMNTVAGLQLGAWIALLVLSAAVVTVLRAAWLRWGQGVRPSRRAWATTGVVAVAWLFASGHAHLPQRASAPSDKPNIILIGLDSLRADLLDPATSPGATPHIQSFMSGGVEFTNTTTPLARTFPSMTSILTGRHPHSTGAFMNLLPRDVIREGDTLPRILKRDGYRTVYATDEVRFSNIDTSYGFDQQVTPPIGSSEFLITLFADTPLSNTLMNTFVGKWLFPHVYANRGAATTYNPDRFVERVDREIDAHQPLMVITHLTLSHWPYVWADAPVMKRDPNDRWPEYYLHVVRRVDQQFQDLMNVFEGKGLLENALVIVYSDHGESFGVPGEALVPDNNSLVEMMGARPQWGHGSTVLTAHQFHVVLGMRGYGKLALARGGKRHGVPASVEDITPTITALVKARTDSPFDGRSLLPLLDGSPTPASFAGRIRFTETEYSPAGLATMDGKVSASALAEAARVYRIDPKTDRIEVKREYLGSLLNVRQYAALGDTTLLAALPILGSTPGYRYLVVDEKGGIPRQLEGPPGEDAPEELRHLWTALHTEFDSAMAQPGHVASSVVDSGVAKHDLGITSSVNK